MTIRARKHAQVRLTVDLVILTVRDATLQILLVERGNEPFAGELSLPGGFMREGEALDAAARRELAEETNLDGGRLHLEQLNVYANPDRDPRGRIVTVAYLAIAPDLPAPVAGTDATDARWQPVEPLLASGGPRSFDHNQILREGLELAREKLEYTTVATAFCGDEFTIGDLRRVYEVVWGVSLDPGNFSRKVTNTEGFVSPTGTKRASETGRPAALYQAGGASGLYPPMLRARKLTDLQPTTIRRYRGDGGDLRGWGVAYALITDPDHEGGWILLIDGVSQSYVDTRDETALKFSYVRRIATVIDTFAAPGAPLRVLHLGAGAMTLPRYVERTRPGSAQVVVDNDAGLLAYVQRHVPLPADTTITTMVADARAAVEVLDDASFDLVISDVYVGAQMPRSVSTVEFARQAARLLSPGGVFVANLADLPLLTFSRVQAATLRTVFDDVCAIGEPGMFRGRRFGNVVMVAALATPQLPVVRLARLARADEKPARLLRGADLEAFVGGAAPLTDASPTAT